jgi:hypothetical protein
MHYLKYIFGIKLHISGRSSVHHQHFFTVHKALHTGLLCLQWKIPDDGRRNCPKRVEFYSKNKFEKLDHLVGFVIRISLLVASCFTTVVTVLSHSPISNKRSPRATWLTKWNLPTEEQCVYCVTTCKEHVWRSCVQLRPLMIVKVRHYGARVHVNA